jgi:hypothetical protein
MTTHETQERPGQINTNGDGRTMEIIIMNDCWKQFEYGVCAARDVT